MAAKAKAEETKTETETTSADERRRARCETIVHASSVAAGAAASVALIPGSDAVAIMPIQVAMVAAIAREHGIEPSASLVRSVIYASLGSIVGKAGAGLLVRWTPIAGNTVRAGVAFG